MGHVVEAATVPPVSPNMQGMSLYRSPSKIMPSLPSHTPHKAGQAARPLTGCMHHRHVQNWNLKLIAFEKTAKCQICKNRKNREMCTFSCAVGVAVAQCVSC